jgi:hypothetical protein
MCNMHIHAHVQAREQLAQAELGRGDASNARVELERLQHENTSLTKKIQALQADKMKIKELQDTNQKLLIQVFNEKCMYVYVCMYVFVYNQASQANKTSIKEWYCNLQRKSNNAPEGCSSKLVPEASENS